MVECCCTGCVKFLNKSYVVKKLEMESQCTCCSSGCAGFQDLPSYMRPALGCQNYLKSLLSYPVN